MILFGEDLPIQSDARKYDQSGEHHHQRQPIVGFLAGHRQFRGVYALERRAGPGDARRFDLVHVNGAGGQRQCERSVCGRGKLVNVHDDSFQRFDYPRSAGLFQYWMPSLPRYQPDHRQIPA
jgi:hypothetical protein